VPEPLSPKRGRPERRAADPSAADRSAAERSVAERVADHAALDQLAATLLPALIAKFGASALGEIEVREGNWRIRLRRPLDGAQPARQARPAERAADKPARPAAHPLDGLIARTESRGVATSPAVGIYRPRTDLHAGERVRAGDRLGAVDMLGVAQEVVAPADGVVGTSLAESGDAVEYGQELLVIELTPGSVASTNGNRAP